jgi:phosphoenolpyruvate carboxykinase (GTP)
MEDVAANIPELTRVDKNEWLAELELINEHYANFGDRLPAEMKKQHKGLTDRLENA